MITEPPVEERILTLTHGLNLSLPGIEIAPLYRPAVRKSMANVYYVDVWSAEESRLSHANYEHPEIMEIDHIWAPNRKLVDCTPPERGSNGP